MTVQTPIPTLEILPGWNSPVGVNIQALLARLLFSLKWIPIVKGMATTSPDTCIRRGRVLKHPIDPLLSVDSHELTGTMNEEEKLTF
jgi:hypothetical protein